MNKSQCKHVLMVVLLALAVTSQAATASDPYADTSAAGSNTNLCDPTNLSVSTSYSIEDTTANALLISLCESSNFGYNSMGSAVAANKEKAQDTASVLKGSLGYV